MAKRERHILFWLILSLCVAAVLSVWYILEKQNPANVTAFATRFKNLSTLGFSAPDGIELTPEDTSLALTWGIYILKQHSPSYLSPCPPMARNFRQIFTWVAHKTPMASPPPAIGSRW